MQNNTHTQIYKLQPYRFWK